MKKADAKNIADDIRSIVLNLSKVNLYNHVLTETEKVLKVLSYADNFDSNYGQLLRNYWGDYKDKGLEREDMFIDFKEKIVQLAIDIETYFREDATTPASDEEVDVYVSEKIINTFAERGKGFNYKKLLALLTELNDNYKKKNTYACFMLLRTIIDHIPPLLGYFTFQQVANNYPLAQTDRAYARTLLGAKEILHDALHRPISKSEDLLDISNLPAKYYLNRILQICTESEVDASQLSKVIVDTPEQNKNLKLKATLPPPIVEVALQSVGGSGDNYIAEFSLTNKGQAPAILQHIDMTGVPKQDLGTFRILGLNETIKVSVQLYGTEFRKMTDIAKLDLFYKDIQDNTYITTYTILRTKRADNLYNIDSLSNFTFFQG